ncbi:hypothetical protein U9M48_008261 [Paspalum notatum var. saurae]|uniref:Gag protein n=1 Tax=Paspalum notatum var. saurae TaxID=547442 RepID=A0AAQ3SNR5_PASNO
MPAKTVAKPVDKPQEEERVPNPKYDLWVVKDQQVLNFLLVSLSREILKHVASEPIAARLWAAIEAMFASQSWARKGTTPMAEYFSRMKALADEMASAGKKLDDEEITPYILAGLDINALTCSRAEATHQQTWLRTAEGIAQAVMAAAVVVVAFSGRQGPPSSSSGPDGERPTCQLCGKIGNTVFRCFKRFDTTFNGVQENKTASVAAGPSAYNIDTNWYSDTGATDHITGELEKLTVKDWYHGGDQVHTASIAGSSNEENPSAQQI